MSKSRIQVTRCGMRCDCGRPWFVWGDALIETRFPTHAEAIAYADSLAHPSPPTLSAHGARLVDDAAQAFREGR